MPLNYEKRDRVGILTFSRPEARNAWGQDYNEGLIQYFEEMEKDDDVLCTVLTGDEDGRAFSAGAFIKDPKTHSLDGADDFIKGRLANRKNSAFEILGNYPKPVIGAVNGYAIGIGCIITFCCDLLIASEQAEWRLPQTSLGILPAYGGLPRLARWIDRGHAMKLAMGFPIKGEEAYRIGLTQWLVPHAELMEKTMEIANRIAALPPLAVRLTKESLVRGMDVPNIADAALTDLYRFALLETTEDKDEGHAAWREKRPAVFKGR